MKASLLARANFAVRCLKLGISSLRLVVELLLLLVGGTAIGYILLGLQAPLPALSLVLLAVIGALTDGAYRLDSATTEARAEAEHALHDLESSAPSLSLGTPVIPAKSQPYEIGWGNGETFTELGRVIRVPVLNALGAEPALGVRARLTFQPRDHSSFSPKQPMPGEWDEPSGPVEEVDLPGNGSPRYLDVVYIRDRPYPHGFAWTRRSRAAGLAGSVIASGRIEIEIEVSASGPTKPQLKDTLTIECHPQQMITAIWTSRSRDDDERGAREWWDGETM